MTPILATIVLYGMSADESPAATSLRTLRADDATIRDAIRWTICDNSPQPHPAPAWFDGDYLADPTNPGLAVPYDRALALAAAHEIPWLLLLDQDTVVTADYLRQAIAATASYAKNSGVVAISPRLVDNGVLCSPIFPPRLGPARSLPAEFHGIAPSRIQPFNSGSLLRVTAVTAIGGFPQDFPLDYLDHATFHLLQNSGGRIAVLPATLPHELSSNHEPAQNPAAIRRQVASLQAEQRFYCQYGSAADRWLRRLRLFRASAGRIARGKDFRVTLRLLRAAVTP